MKRRTFIWLSTAVSISAMLPLATSCSSVPNFEELLATPLTLMLLNDSKTIRKLGKQHLKLSSTHLEKEMLIALLLKNNQGKEISKSSSTLAIQHFIQKKNNSRFFVRKYGFNRWLGAIKNRGLSMRSFFKT